MCVSPAGLLHPPPLMGRELSRPRLVPATGTGTTEVWSAAGTGKTTLLAMWASELASAGETTAWISLPAVGGPAPLLAALTRILPGPDGRRLTVLIDDIHCLDTAADGGRWLAALIASRPWNVRFVLAGRHPPQLPYNDGARSRPAPPAADSPSGGATLTYGTQELAFTTAETAAFLGARGIHLIQQDLDIVQALTGGWAAALTLLPGMYLGYDSHRPTPANRDRDYGSPPGSLFELLTPKEQEILHELPQYQTVQSIAARQQLSPNTVKTHIRSLYQKLGVTSRAAAVSKAIDNGLL
ncbi:hypothetical protein KKR91_07640 [Arthrobacter jiangjiafuii]|uniref:HTH luxR-type domain-containing protein n=1 Tax=Arthrobacter jiangjiafuii TaxID=2817475 RepID=A0A975M7N6_9MICC|nr:LuxR C-terminal-related transcriptional regulator [Arthrobacter jiangjiafuii]MBP3044472.1 hypothetical protein [Arthrobacter jiangjiafuii]QWC11412.1 hypothetical protein KKR91_07640 [Arthrobacter jiangjiafuii]